MRCFTSSDLRTGDNGFRVREGGEMLLAILLGLAAAAVVAVGLEFGLSGARTKELRRPVVVASITAAVAIGLAGPAFAASSQNTGFTYRTSFECTQNHVYISDTTGKPHLDSWTENDGSNAYTNSPCDVNTPIGLAAGLIRVAQDILRWNGSQWTFCNIGAFYYNGSNKARVSTGYNFSYPCGKGYYYGQTEGEVYNGAWYGGYLATPNYLNIT